MSTKDYKFTYGVATVVNQCVGGLVIDFPNGASMLSRDDIAHMAKLVKLNAHDIQCSEHIALQADSDAIDEAHFDECQDLRMKIYELRKNTITVASYTQTKYGGVTNWREHVSNLSTINSAANARYYINKVNFLIRRVTNQEQFTRIRL